MCTGVLAYLIAALIIAALPFFALGFLFPKWLSSFDRFHLLKSSFARRWILPIGMGLLLTIAFIAILITLDICGDDTAVPSTQDMEASDRTLLAWWTLILVDVLLLLAWVRRASREHIARIKKVAAATLRVGVYAKKKTEEWINAQH
jgi:hypothetical protein